MTEFPLLRHLMWELADVIYEELDGNLNRRRKSLLAPRFTRITSRTNVSVPRTSRERDLLLRGHDTILKTLVRVGRKPGGSETEPVVAACFRENKNIELDEFIESDEDACCDEENLEEFREKLLGDLGLSITESKLEPGPKKSTK